MTSQGTIRLLGALLMVAPLAAALVPPAAHAAANGDSAMFKLDSVTFTGNQRVTTEQLQSIVGLTPGQKVDRDMIIQAFSNVTAEYKKDNVGGSIQPVMTLPRPGHMAVEFQISELAAAAPIVVQPKLAHETFTGNAKVASALLQPAMTMKPEQDVSTDQIVADQKALMKIYSGAGHSVLVSPKINKVDDTHVDVNYELNENPPPAK